MCFVTRRARTVLFAQQRVFDSEGGKNDLPWTRWSDGQWRNCKSVDGLLPLYELDHLSKLSNSDAPRPQRLRRRPPILPRSRRGGGHDPRGREDGRFHPQDALRREPRGRQVEGGAPSVADLRQYAHVGWPGGANNSHRVDWEPIRRLAASVEVVVVADRNQQGEEAVSTISRHLKRQLTAVVFPDSNFPAHFDLADGWPRSKGFWRGGRYVGPGISEPIV